MPKTFEIRADYAPDSIVVYQAYPDAIADAALAAQRFVSPFSTARVTWIKPSFLWLMHRSNWACKRGQQRVLAVRITREGWEKALSAAVLTAYDRRAHRSMPDWHDEFRSADAHVQWDPERNLRGSALQHYSIQVGLGRGIITQYRDHWTLGIKDITAQVRKIHSLLRQGRGAAARHLVPRERIYEVETASRKRLLP